MFSKQKASVMQYQYIYNEQTKQQAICLPFSSLAAVLGL